MSIGCLVDIIGLLKLLKDFWQKDTIISMEELKMWRNSHSRPKDREIDFKHPIRLKEHCATIG
jgi:hypothetical protein